MQKKKVNICLNVSDNEKQLDYGYGFSSEDEQISNGGLHNIYLTDNDYQSDVYNATTVNVDQSQGQDQINEQSLSRSPGNQATQNGLDNMYSLEEDYSNLASNIAGLTEAIRGVAESENVISGSSKSSNGSNWIYIGGLFESSTREGKAALKAAEMAIEHVNQKRIVEGYQLKLEWNNTKVVLSEI